MSNSSNQQNNENQRVSDLIRDFQLITHFLADGATQHTVYRVSDQSRHRRPSRIDETWNRQQELGRGGFGCVWLERCTSVPGEGKLRAVKEIWKAPSQSVLYSRELEAMAKFSHKRYVHCFVECYGWYESENKVFIAMEYIEHGDLQNYLNEPFSEAHVKIIISQLAEGLEFMHMNGFAHRDLKPKNILVYQPSPDWWVKIGDFGISKRAEGTALRTIIGTEGYIAPEVMGFIPDQSSSLSNAFSYSFAVDIWALGELLFRMIAQRPVFPNQSDLFYYVINRNPFPIAILKATGVSQDCCNVITECMAVDPKHRPKASEIQMHPWMQISRPLSPSPSNGHSSPIRGCEVPPHIPTEAPTGPLTLNPPTVIYFEDTARWSGSQEHQQVYAQHIRQEELNELLWASQNGHIEVVKALLAKGLDVTVVDKSGLTPLHHASRNGYVEVVKALLEKGADVMAASPYGSTPLHYASRNGHIEVVKTLLEKGADGMAANKDGLTPLHMASQYGYVGAVIVLLWKGANVMVVDKEGQTPLHMASQNGYTEVVRVLLDMKADIAATDKISLTPLHWASGNGHIEVAKALLERGADVTTASQYGSTPLHFASRNGYVRVVKALLGKGADVMLVDKEGQTPLDLARQNGRTGCVEAVKVLEESWPYSRGEPQLTTDLDGWKESRVPGPLRRGTRASWH